jgi:hypothetical protein
MKVQRDTQVLIVEDAPLVGKMIQGVLEDMKPTFKNIPRLCLVMAFALNVGKSCTQRFSGMMSRWHQKMIILDPFLTWAVIRS